MITTTLVLLGLTVASYAARKLAPQAHFFHTGGGAALLAAGSALLGAAAAAVQAQGLDWTAITNACAATLMSLLASANPSVPDSKLELPRSPLNLVPVFLFGMLGFSACATTHLPPS